MPQKRKKQAGGVPDWVVTFGDMMSLLLCFFILLQAFSELKREHEYQRVITAVKEAFGFSGGVGVLPTDDPPLRSMIEILEAMAQQHFKKSKVSHSDERGITGKRTRVSRVHDGMMFTIGGNITFDPGSAELKDNARAELEKIGDLLRGRNNKIAVRGHAANKQLPENSAFADLRDLSYYRAKAVADYLVAEVGIDPEVLIVDARGATEPVEARAYSADDQTQNRRVEVIMLEVMNKELSPNADYSSEASAE
ncbi:MAG: OmpA family protein [Phycisphaerales bacterium]